MVHWQTANVTQDAFEKEKAKVSSDLRKKQYMWAKMHCKNKQHIWSRMHWGNKQQYVSQDALQKETANLSPDAFRVWAQMHFPGRKECELWINFPEQGGARTTSTSNLIFSSHLWISLWFSIILISILFHSAFGIPFLHSLIRFSSVSTILQNVWCSCSSRL